MKTYTFKITIKEGNDEFWEEHKNAAEAIPELYSILSMLLDSNGFGEPESTLELIEYTE